MTTQPNYTDLIFLIIQFLKSRSSYIELNICLLNYADISKRLSTILVRIFNQLLIPIVFFGFEAVRDIHQIRYTRNTTWQGGFPRNDWIWAHYTSFDVEYEELTNKFPTLCSLFFEFENPWSVTTHCFALICTFIYLFHGLSGEDHKIVRIRFNKNAHRSIQSLTITVYNQFFRVIVSIENILEAAHIIPHSSDVNNDHFWINSYIDLDVFNIIY